MRIVDGQVVLDDFEQCEADLADGDLSRIVRQKEDLTDWLDNVKRNGGGDFASLAAAAEEAFDDHLTAMWHSLTKKSGSVEWTAEIPSCDTLRAKLASERRVYREARDAEARIREANMATAVEMGIVNRKEAL